MRDNSRVEMTNNNMGRDRVIDSLNSTRQSINLIKSKKPELKLHIALKLSRFFELRIEDDFDMQ